MINCFTKTFREKFVLSKALQKDKLNNWDVVFISAYVLMNRKNQYYWRDIESLILEVATTVLNSEEPGFNDRDFPNEENKRLFINLITYAFKNGKEISDSMLDDLHSFERIFGTYISNQVNSQEDFYFGKVNQLIEQIVKESNNDKVKLDVINFNYSLDENLVNKMQQKGYLEDISINSWTNIHGIANWNDNSTRMGIYKIHNIRVVLVKSF